MNVPAIPYRSGVYIPPAAKPGRLNASNQNARIENFFAMLETGQFEEAERHLAQDRRLAIAEGVDGWTAPFYAIRFDSARALQAFACLGCDINHADDEGRSPLMMAATKGAFGCVATLLQFDYLDMNVQSIDGRTALTSALELGHCHIAHALLQKRASVIIGTDARTPIDLARNCNHLPWDIRLIIEQRYRQLH